MNITNNNLFSESFSQIKSFLDGINALDTRGRFKANFIHSSMPNINSKGFDGYPFIVLRADVEEENKAFDRTTSDKVFRVMMQVYSTEATDVDSITDKLFSNFKDETKLTDFVSRELSASPINWDLDLNGKKVLFRNFSVILRSRI
jgi:hypothetical protein